MSNPLADLLAAPFANLDELIAALEQPGVVRALSGRDPETFGSLPTSWAFGGEDAGYGDDTIEVIAWDETRVVSIVLDAGRPVLRVEERE